MVRLSSALSLDILSDFPFRQNTSPYVQSVPGASFSRHGTLLAAYNAYVEAYAKNFVSYV